MLFRAGRSEVLVVLSAWVARWSLASSVPVSRCGAGDGAAGHSFAAVCGMKRFAGDGRSGSINGGDLAGFGGHDLGDPRLAESGCSRRAGWVVQGTDVVIAQSVEDELELSSGGGHGADVAVGAAMSDLFADRADAAGIGQDLHRFDRRPP